MLPEYDRQEGPAAMPTRLGTCQHAMTEWWAHESVAQPGPAFQLGLVSAVAADRGRRDRGHPERRHQAGRGGGVRAGKRLVVASQRGHAAKVLPGPDAIPVPGWYAYLTQPGTAGQLM